MFQYTRLSEELLHSPVDFCPKATFRVGFMSVGGSLQKSVSLLAVASVATMAIADLAKRT